MSEIRETESGIAAEQEGIAYMGELTIDVLSDGARSVISMAADLASIPRGLRIGVELARA